MRKNFRNLVALVLGIVFVGVFLTGCITGGPPSPSPSPAPTPGPSFGSVTICSGGTEVYGNVYIDGEHLGFLGAGECVRVDPLELEKNYTVRVENQWGEVFTQNFYFSSSGQEVTVR